MTERGMIFNAEMVRAILGGRKTQTRRLIKLSHERGMKNPVVRGKKGEISYVGCRLAPMLCPLGQPGDRIWVRETWAEAGGNAPELQLYRANYPEHVPSRYENLKSAEEIRWTPSIHMPRWASRITLEITDVRVERLNSISDDDARAEGCAGGHDSIPDYHYSATPHEHFRHVWTSIYGEEGWSSAWVWVIEFRRVEGGAA